MSDSPQPSVFLNKRKGSSGGKSSGSPLSAKGLVRKDVNKRWMMAGLAGAAVVGVIAVAMAPEKTERSRRAAPESRISVTPPNAEKASFEQLYQKELQGVQTELKRIKTNEQKLTDTLASMREELDKKTTQLAEQAQKAGSSQPNMGSAVSPPKLGGGGLTIIGTAGGPPAPPMPLNGVPSGQVAGNGQFVPPSLGGAVLPPSTPRGPAPRIVSPVMYDAPEGATVTPTPEEAAKKEAGTRDKANAEKTIYQRNTKAGMLPAGSFASIAMFNGLDAGTSSTTQSNPMPVLMNIQDQATLPGSATYKIRNCFALGNGYGDLSAERVYVRVNRISCMDNKNQMILSQEISGYLVDSDGKLGLRGIVYNRQGALLGKSMLAGFAQGLASALGSAQSTVTSSLSTGLTSSAISGGAAIRASGLQGAQQATAQLAEFYLKEAQSIFPVISIDAGRTGTLVFTNDAILEWSSAVDRFVADEQKPNK